MISVVIPTLNAAKTLGPVMASLAEANLDGLIREVIVSDGGSTDQTLAMAEEAGARIVRGAKGRGPQLRAGGQAARGPWLLFLHADTRLEPGWEKAALTLIDSGEERAAVFRLAFSARGFRPALVAWGANVRARLFGLPYGDQGLLMAKAHYERLGGHAPLPLFEDVNLIERILAEGGRRALVFLKPRAITGADRYEKDGYIRRVWRNFRCILSYKAGMSPAQIAEVYHGRTTTDPRPDGEAAPDRAGEDAPRP